MTTTEIKPTEIAKELRAALCEYVSTLSNNELVDLLIAMRSEDVPPLPLFD